MNTSSPCIVVLSYEYIITLHCCVKFINMWHWGYKLKLEKKVLGFVGGTLICSLVRLLIVEDSWRFGKWECMACGATMV